MGTEQITSLFNKNNSNVNEAEVKEMIDILWKEQRK